MIARDEAGFLDQCLASVSGLVDEIIVVDTGSTDDTLDVARRHGARTLTHPWTNDFSAARNTGIAASTGKWILALDCDEVLAASDHARIRELLNQTDIDAFRMTTRNYTNESNRAAWTRCTGEYAKEEKEYSGWFPTTKVRLWRNRDAIRFAGTVHELVENSIVGLGGAIGDCMVPVHHVGYIEKERPDDLYVRAGEAKVQANPDDLQAQYELAIAYRNSGQLAEALESVQRAARGSVDGGSGTYLDRELVLLVEADILDRSGRADDALTAYRGILDAFPKSHQALNNLGSLLERHGSLEEARQCYEMAIAHAPANQTITDNLLRLRTKLDRPNRLSVCIITRNAERTLPNCLDSVSGLADEIVVVDTGSDDATLEIAERHGARIGHFSWCDDFAAARNAALEMATGDWILCLDADEYLDAENAQKVAHAKALRPDRALYCSLVDVESGGLWFRQVKMFPNDQAIRFERPVHENVVQALRRLDLPVAATDVIISHSGNADLNATAEKNQKYLAMMLKWYEFHVDDEDVAFHIGYAYYVDGSYAEAASYFKNAYDLGPERTQTPSLYAMAAAFLGRCYLNLERTVEAVGVLEQALSARPGDALIHLAMAEAKASVGDNAGVVTHAEKSIAARPDPTLSLDTDSIVSAARTLRDRFRKDAGGNESGNRLSLCMIVRDEESRLPVCLESVSGLVDEIVVVDTGSHDATIQVAESFGARIGHFEWCDDFALARNASLELATGDWVMWLDADDVLPKEEHQKILSLVAEGRDRAYFFALDDDGYENVSCLQMRLFPNRPGVAFEMPIHEQITPSLIRLGVELKPTDIRVVHTGYTTPDVVRAKKDRYLRIMENWLQRSPR